MWYFFPKSSTGGAWILNRVAHNAMDDKRPIIYTGEGKIIQFIMVEVNRNEPHESKSKPVLRGTAPPTQKLPCFVLYISKLSASSLKNNI